MFSSVRHIHMVGVGGVGMSGIAEVLLNLGYEVSGSDLKESDATARLRSLGARVAIGHTEVNVAGAHVVVVSTAVRTENVELVAARAQGIPIIPRVEMLSELMRMKYGIAVAGCHGKTTTTSMAALVLTRGGLDPTAVIGGRVAVFGGNARIGKGEYLVAEADESDGSMNRLSPTVAVVTNVDTDHLDFYGSIERIEDAFVEFMNRVPFYGFVAMNLDDPRLARLRSRVTRRVVTYGVRTLADCVAQRMTPEGFGTRFDVVHRGMVHEGFRLQVPGLHNVQNALAAACVALELNVPADRVRAALAEFAGVHRRFERKGTFEGATVVDDYGHHPTEIEATLRAARQVLKAQPTPGRLIAVFQPHRFTRTQFLHREFGPALALADEVLLLPVYAAGEAPIAGVDAGLIAESARGAGIGSLRMLASVSDAVPALSGRVQPADLVITLGAGNVWQAADHLVTAASTGVSRAAGEVR